MSFLVAVRLLQPACTLKIRNWNWKKKNMLLIYFDKWVKNQLFLENWDFWEDGRWLRGKKSPNGFFCHLNEKYFLPKKNSDEILKENTQKRFNNSSLVRPMWYIVRVLNESLSWKEFSSELWNDFNFFFGPSVKQNNLRMCLKCHLLSHFTISVENHVIWPKIRQETICAVFSLSFWVT